MAHVSVVRGEGPALGPPDPPLHAYAPARTRARILLSILVMTKFSDEGRVSNSRPRRTCRHERVAVAWKASALRERGVDDDHGEDMRVAHGAAPACAMRTSRPTACSRRTRAVRALTFAVRTSRRARVSSVSESVSWVDV